MRNFFIDLKYILFQVIRDRGFMFWMLAFPILLCTIFALVFSNIGYNEELKVRIGLENESPLKNVLQAIEVVELVESNKDDLLDQVKSKKIDIFVDNNLDVNLLESNNKTNLGLSVLETIKKYSYAYMVKESYDGDLGLNAEEILKLDYKNLSALIEESIVSGKVNILDFGKNIANDFEEKSEDTNVVKTLLFTAVSMFSLYGIYMSIHTTEKIQGNLSALAIRIGISPVKKIKRIALSFVFSFLMGAFIILVIILYIKFVLRLDLISNLLASVYILLFANFWGNAFGTLFGVFTKLNVDQKMGITTGTLLFLSFASGMSGNSGGRIWIRENLPILDKMNPVSVISEVLYKANELSDTSILFSSNLILLIEALFAFMIAGIFLRRTSYDSL